MNMLDPQRKAMLSQPRKLGSMLQSLEASLLWGIARVSGKDPVMSLWEMLERGLSFSAGTHCLTGTQTGRCLL